LFQLLYCGSYFAVDGASHEEHVAVALLLAAQEAEFSNKELDTAQLEQVSAAQPAPGGLRTLVEGAHNEVHVIYFVATIAECLDLVFAKESAHLLALHSHEVVTALEPELVVCARKLPELLGLGLVRGGFIQLVFAELAFLRLEPRFSVQCK